MPSVQSVQEFPHQKLFFDLKDKNYKKAKMKGGLGWMKNIGNDPARFLMGTIFLVIIIIIIRFFRWVFSECTEAITTSLIYQLSWDFHFYNWL